MDKDAQKLPSDLDVADILTFISEKRTQAGLEEDPFWSGLAAGTHLRRDAAAFLETRADHWATLPPPTQKSALLYALADLRAPAPPARPARAASPSQAMRRAIEIYLHGVSTPAPTASAADPDDASLALLVEFQDDQAPPTALSAAPGALHAAILRGAFPDFASLSDHLRERQEPATPDGDTLRLLAIQAYPEAREAALVLAHTIAHPSFRLQAYFELAPRLQDNKEAAAALSAAADEALPGAQAEPLWPGAPDWQRAVISAWTDEASVAEARFDAAFALLDQIIDPIIMGHSLRVALWAALPLEGRWVRVLERILEDRVLRRSPETKQELILAAAVLIPLAPAPLRDLSLSKIGDQVPRLHATSKRALLAAELANVSHHVPGRNPALWLDSAFRILRDGIDRQSAIPLILQRAAEADPAGVWDRLDKLKDLSSQLMAAYLVYEHL